MAYYNYMKTKRNNIKKKIYIQSGGLKKDYKPLILKIFKKLYTYYSASNNFTNSFRALAYKKSINSIEKYLKPIYSISDAKNITQLTKKSLSKIETIIKTRSLPIYDELKGNKTSNALVEFQKIIGVGPKIAKSWISKGILSLNELKKAVKNKQIVLNETQSYGLKYYNELNTKISRKNIEKVVLLLKNELKDLKKIYNLDYNIVGSYRLGKNESGDIDLIITYDQLKTDNNILRPLLIEKLKKYIIYILSESKNKTLCIMKFKNNIKPNIIRVDIVNIPRPQYPWYLLYFGSDVNFSRKIRSYAKQKGYKLNEKGLFYKNNNKKVDFHPENEKDIFKFLNLKYIKPKNRLNSGSLSNFEL